MRFRYNWQILRDKLDSGRRFVWLRHSVSIQRDFLSNFDTRVALAFESELPLFLQRRIPFFCHLVRVRDARNVSTEEKKQGPETLGVSK